jgi:hypothetical protein
MKCAKRECIKQTDGESNYCEEHQFTSTSTTRTITGDVGFRKEKSGGTKYRGVPKDAPLSGDKGRGGKD